MVWKENEIIIYKNFANYRRKHLPAPVDAFFYFQQNFMFSCELFLGDYK